ncbi:hypothetical protein Tco_1311404 [Tanacetum coccineum]
MDSGNISLNVPRQERLQDSVLLQGQDALMQAGELCSTDENRGFFFAENRSPTFMFDVDDPEREEFGTSCGSNLEADHCDAFTLMYDRLQYTNLCSCKSSSEDPIYIKTAIKLEYSVVRVNTSLEERIKARSNTKRIGSFLLKENKKKVVLVSGLQAFKNIDGESQSSRLYENSSDIQLGIDHFEQSTGQFCDSDLKGAFRKHSACSYAVVQSFHNQSHGSGHRRLKKPFNKKLAQSIDLPEKIGYRLQVLKFRKDHLAQPVNLEQATRSPTNQNLKTPKWNSSITLHMIYCGPDRSTNINGRNHLVIVMTSSRFTCQIHPKQIITESSTKLMSEYYEGLADISIKESDIRNRLTKRIVERRNRTTVEAARTNADIPLNADVPVGDSCRLLLDKPRTRFPNSYSYNTTKPNMTVMIKPDLTFSSDIWCFVLPATNDTKI